MRTPAERKADEASAEVRRLEAERAPEAEINAARERRASAWDAVRRLREGSRV